MLSLTGQEPSWLSCFERHRVARSQRERERGSFGHAHNFSMSCKEPYFARRLLSVAMAVLPPAGVTSDDLANAFIIPPVLEACKTCGCAACLCLWMLSRCRMEANCPPILAISLVETAHGSLANRMRASAWWKSGPHRIMRDPDRSMRVIVQVSSSLAGKCARV